MTRFCDIGDMHGTRLNLRFIVILKAGEDSEAEIEPDGWFLTRMLDYEEDLVKAGVLRLRRAMAWK
jgi:hypothetical protein